MKYTVKAGDTLGKIAAQFTIGGSAYAVAIANANNIPNPNLIQIGQVLDIPNDWLKPEYQTASQSGGASGSWAPPIVAAPVPRMPPPTSIIPSSAYNTPPSQATASKFSPTTWLLIGGAVLIVGSILMGSKK